jgi:hypothetical protein
MECQGFLNQLSRIEVLLQGAKQHTLPCIEEASRRIRTYCQTIENKARTMVAAGLQSIGYQQLYEHVFSLTGIQLREDDITSLFLCSEDSEKLWRMLHRRKEYVKISRMRTLYKKLRDGVSKLKVDNGKALGYQTGMMGLGGADEDHGRRPKKGQEMDQSQICKPCGSKNHSRRASKHCLANPKKQSGARGSTTRYVGTCSCDIKICYVT